jgi:Serine carboxypeptidase
MPQPARAVMKSDGIACRGCRPSGARRRQRIDIGCARLHGQCVSVCGLQGHYVPTVAKVVWDANKTGRTVVPIRLRGFAIGNGLTDPAVQYGAYSDFAFDHGLISESTKTGMQWVRFFGCDPGSYPPPRWKSWNDPVSTRDLEWQFQGVELEVPAPAPEGKAMTADIAVCLLRLRSVLACGRGGGWMGSALALHFHRARPDPAETQWWLLMLGLLMGNTPNTMPISNPNHSGALPKESNSMLAALVSPWAVFV